MSDKNPIDPFAFFRDALNQWEKAANEMGSTMLQSPQTIELMHKGTAASMQMQSAMKDGMEKALAAAQLPSKADIDALARQLGAIETQLARIEAKLTGRSETEAGAVPQPKRTRKPPTA